MAAKGTISKELVKQRIIDAFGASYLGEKDKKLYVQMDEEGEKVQIAISMTCPKNSPFGAEAGDGEPSPSIELASEINPEERKVINSLLEKFGL